MFMSDLAEKFPYTSALKEQFKAVIGDPQRFENQQKELIARAVDFSEGGSKYLVTVTLEAEGEVQTVGLSCDDASAISSEFRAIFHTYLGENNGLYTTVEKRFAEKTSVRDLDAVSYLVSVDKGVYWNVLVTLSYLDGAYEAV